MHVIVAGSRGIQDRGIVEDALAHFEREHGPVTRIISGTARGVDKLGEAIARERKLGLIRMPADWKAHGKSAGFKRNQAMAEVADGLVAVWDGHSPGTRHMIRTAQDKGLKLLVWSPRQAIFEGTHNKWDPQP